MKQLTRILSEINWGGYKIQPGQVVTYKDMPAFKTEAQIRQEEEDCEDVSEGKIRIQDDEDFSWWSDRYKEEVGIRPRMSHAELERWINTNFKLKGKKYVPINETTDDTEWVAFVEYEGSMRKKLLNVLKSARAAKMWMSKNSHKLLNDTKVRAVGTMTKKEWDKFDAKYAIK